MLLKNTITLTRFRQRSTFLCTCKQAADFYKVGTYQLNSGVKTPVG